MKTLLFTCFIFTLFIGCEGQNKTSNEMAQKDTSSHTLFVGTYTRTEGHVDGKANGIYALNFNSTDGKLTTTNMKAETINPSYLTLDRTKNMVYAVNEIADGSEAGGAFIKSFTFDLDGETLTEVGSIEANGGAPCHISNFDNYIFTANYVGGNFEVFSLDKKGVIRDNIQIIKNSGTGESSRQEGPHGHMITRNPHTNQILTVDLGTDEVSIYDFDTKKGLLSLSEIINVEPGSGPRHVDFHPSQDIIYVVNELSGTVEVYKKNDGTYDQLQIIHTTINPNNEDAGCAAIKMHHSGRYLFVSNRGPFNSIMTYEVKSDGFLEIKSEKSSMGEVPRDFTIDPSGNYLLAANQNSDNIVVYKIDIEGGRLIDTGESISVPTPVCLKFL